jgi:hypothetical protein
VLSGAGERVSKMLKITSVESLFLTFPTLEDAIGELMRAGTAQRQMIQINLPSLDGGSLVLQSALFWRCRDHGRSRT